MTTPTMTTLFDKKVLYISDMVVPSDIPKIIHYFETFNIAKVYDVIVYEHLEEEYFVEDLDLYCNAVIIIEHWYNNTDAKSFYTSLLENKCKMVYNDPKYWTLEFYDQPEEYNNIALIIKQEEEPEVKKEEPEVKKEEPEVKKEEPEVKKEEPEEEVYYLGYGFYEKLDKQKSPKRSKRKFNAEMSALKTENNELKTLLIKKNKNFLKNNKDKARATIWLRRLREKQSE
jgi:hypothetical protein